jgi:hypothetical protein
MPPICDKGSIEIFWDKKYNLREQCKGASSTPRLISNFTLKLNIYLGSSLNEVTEIRTAFDIHLIGPIQIKRDTLWHILHPQHPALWRDILISQK